VSFKVSKCQTTHLACVTRSRLQGDWCRWTARKLQFTKPSLGLYRC